MTRMIPPIEPCPACKLQKNPEIIGRQESLSSDACETLRVEWAVQTTFKVQCPTCAHGHELEAYLSPEEAVRAWNEACPVPPVEDWTGEIRKAMGRPEPIALGPGE